MVIYRPEPFTNSTCCPSGAHTASWPVRSPKRLAGPPCNGYTQKGFSEDGPTLFSAASKEEWVVETSSNWTLGKVLRNLETSPPVTATFEMIELSPDISVKYRNEPSEAKLVFTSPSCVIWLRPDTLGGEADDSATETRDPTESDYELKLSKLRNHFFVARVSSDNLYFDYPPVHCQSKFPIVNNETASSAIICTWIPVSISK